MPYLTKRPLPPADAYRATGDDSLVVRVSDGAFVPNDPMNPDRIEFETWLAAGNEPLPPDPEDVEVLGTELLARFTDQEYAGIIGAANAQLSSGNAQLYRWIETLRATNSVRVFSDAAQAAKAALVGTNLLTAERADAIFS